MFNKDHINQIRIRAIKNMDLIIRRRIYTFKVRKLKILYFTYIRLHVNMKNLDLKYSKKKVNSASRGQRQKEISEILKICCSNLGDLNCSKVYNVLF